ncbi:hypothetical protein EMPS_05240 [Entomortierella parvispora]|uniref:Uncharacterized protein n=1 Tax=Entomortierella parvispora TaxID=205924 RepID=A0A9P3HA30_9FUNG|nr:hypothetical protein EMPS_05240 [Entomortierella parvispora]
MIPVTSYRCIEVCCHVTHVTDPDILYPFPPNTSASRLTSSTSIAASQEPLSNSLPSRSRSLSLSSTGSWSPPHSPAEPIGLYNSLSSGSDDEDFREEANTVTPSTNKRARRTIPFGLTVDNVAAFGRLPTCGACESVLERNEQRFILKVKTSEERGFSSVISYHFADACIQKLDDQWRAEAQNYLAALE